MIRRVLSAGAGFAPGNCPGADELAAYFEHSLPNKEAARYESHFSNCPRCRTQLAAMARADARTVKVARPAREVHWISSWRWIAPAATALAVLLVWVALRPAKRSTQPPSVQTEATAVSPSGPPVAAMRESAPPQIAENVPPVPLARGRVKVPQRKVTTPKLSRENVSRDARESAATAGAPSSGASSQNTAPGLADQLAEKEEAEGARANAPVSPAETNQPAIAPAASPPSAQATAANEERTSDRAAKYSRAAAPRSKISAGVAGGVGGLSESKPLVQTLEVVSAGTLIPTPDEQVVWRVGPAGTIERSENSGRSWYRQFTGTREDLLGGSAISAKICWVIGRAGTVLRTTDGTDWKLVAGPAEADLVSIEARNSQAATVTAADGRKFSTDDGGKTWKLEN